MPCYDYRRTMSDDHFRVRDSGTLSVVTENERLTRLFFWRVALIWPEKPYQWD